MGGYGAVSGLTITSVGLAVILMAITSMIGAASRRLAIEQGFAGVRELCELTGITNVKDLQDIFGPPDLNRVWRNLTLERVMAERRPAGHLISGRVVNWVSIFMAVFALVRPNELVLLGLFLACFAQIGGWALSVKLPK